MAITEKRQFYKLEALINISTVNLDNIDVKFNSITLCNDYDDDEVVIKDRRVVFEKDRSSDGVRLAIYILNEGTEIKDRIDYLIDEEYEIQDLDLEVKRISTDETLTYTLLCDEGEQVEKEVEIEMDPVLKKSSEFIIDRVTEGNATIKNVIFNTLKEDEDLQRIINDIIDIPVI